MKELAVILGTLAVGKEVAEGHALHVILVQVLALVALFALAAEPVLAHVSPFDALVPHRALVAGLAGALGEPAQKPITHRIAACQQRRDKSMPLPPL